MSNKTLDDYGNDAEPKHGDQFLPERLAQGTTDHGIRKFYKDAFDVRNVVGVETGETHDTYKEQKALHEIIDYSGSDYIIDTYKKIFGVNHRVNGSGTKRRFDIRSDTSTEKPSTLESLLGLMGDNSIKPKYASRLKEDGSGGVEWVRIVKLQPLIRAIVNGQIKPAMKIDCDGGVEASLFEYDALRALDAVVYEVHP